jgi:hypothetical protein
LAFSLRVVVAAGLAIATPLDHPKAVQSRPPEASAPTHHPMFRETALSKGLDFTHISGASNARHFPEIMGSGGLFFDFDNDGWLDIFLVDGGSLADSAVAQRARHRLYRGLGNDAFRGCD